MAKIKLSKEAATKAITYSDEANNELMNNVRVMDSNVNSQFSGLRDPAFRRYLELSDEMQALLLQVGARMSAISDYCRSVIRWIDTYSEI